MSGWSVACRFGLRELRSGVRGFRVLIACLALGVAAVAGVGSLAAALSAGLKAEGRVLLGGDVDLAFTHRRASREQLEWLQGQTAGISTVIELRTMARPISGSGRQRLVELKAVDKGYPLYGGLKLRDGVNLARIHAQEAGVWGAAVDPRVLEQLGITTGGLFRIGDAKFRAVAIFDREPDRGT